MAHSFRPRGLALILDPMRGNIPLARVWLAGAFTPMSVSLHGAKNWQLARLALPEALHEAVVAAQRMRSHGARTRQIQYIGKVMRQLDPTALSRVHTALAPGQAGAPRPQP